MESQTEQANALAEFFAAVARATSIAEVNIAAGIALEQLDATEQRA